jgi:hypothetical protein
VGCFGIFNGTCGFRCDIPMPTFLFATDACETGGGGFLAHDWFYTAWVKDIPEVLNRNINELELLTVFLALKRWGPVSQHQHVCIRSDNMATVSALNKSTSRSVVLMPWVREIFWVSVEFDVTITSRHIPGIDNVLADRISRLDSMIEAREARLILANFSNAAVSCENHMSMESFVYLQEAWRRISYNYPVRQTCSREMR